MIRKLRLTWRDFMRADDSGWYIVHRAVILSRVHQSATMELICEQTNGSAIRD